MRDRIGADIYREMHKPRHRNKVHIQEDVRKLARGTCGLGMFPDHTIVKVTFKVYMS